MQGMFIASQGVRLGARTPRDRRNESGRNLAYNVAASDVDASSEHNGLGAKTGARELSRDSVACTSACVIMEQMTHIKGRY